MSFDFPRSGHIIAEWHYALADLRFCVVPDAPEPTANDPSYASARIHVA